MKQSDASKRRAEALAMHRSGMTYKEIGDRWGVTKSRIGQLVQAGRRAETYVPPEPEREPRITLSTKINDLWLSRRVTNLLANCDINTVGDLVKEQREVFRREMLRVPNCNEKAWREIERVLDGIELENPANVASALS
ncbi:helix-turn-helix domain-containing protein [Sphingomonas colocasiae]|uniref:Helix-turn-helix domain-containing protein n=1 Tax=Sphingomonas colocasiae TaxID=1848973 RepID=A0ABS7PIH7_9SPHN|nr:helix-turn-helix domain-containing protein [Sphingomonas colocasiae]MBY8821086.1 helix-turn-helix domain-containing protein [Sphingomonas colocasiae]